MYKILNGLSAIKATGYTKFSQTKTRKNHSLTLKPYSPSTECFKQSFFPRTIPEWNALPAEAVLSGSPEEFKSLIYV